MKNKIFAIICSATCLLSFALTTHHFQFLPLKPISIEKLTFSKDEKEISIAAKAYTGKESKTFLERDLPAKGYQPIQVVIQNNSPSSYHLKLDAIEDVRVSPSKIASKVFQESIPRSIGLKIASFFFWPFAIGSAIDSLHTLKTYQNLKQDYQAKELREETIPPYSTVSRVLFVKSNDLSETLTLYLVDAHTGEEISYLTTVSNA